MFSLYSRSRLHSFGEIIQPYRFWWKSPPERAQRLGLRGPQPALDPLAAPPRRRRLQRLVHVPDPAPGARARSGCRCRCSSSGTTREFGVRAKEAGYPTVTFPGAAVWHVPWTDKNDALDWQSYFHQRNRFVAALLHSPYEHGGRMVRESLNHQIKHLVSMQYSTVELRHKALEDVLRRARSALHGDLADQARRGPRVRASSSPTRSCRPTPTPSRRCAARSRRARARTAPRSRAGSSQLVTAGLAPLRQLRPTARAVAGVPRGGDPRDGRQVVPPGPLRLRGRLDARRHLGRALPARPGAVPRPAQADARDPPAAAPRVAASWPSEYREQARRRSPRRRRGRRPSASTADA